MNDIVIGRYLLCGFLFAQMSWALPLATALETNPTNCTAFFRRGAFHQAATCWRTVIQRANSPSARYIALRHLAEVYQRLGHNHKAIESLKTALAWSRIEQLHRQVQMTLLLNQLGNAYGAIGDVEMAEQHLREALNLATQLAKPGLLADVLNHLGTLFMSQQQFADALQMYRESAGQAMADDRTAALARALCNGARAALQSRQYTVSQKLLDDAWVHVQRATASHDTAYILISIGRVARRLRSHLSEVSDTLLRRAFIALQQAADLAQTLRDDRAMSYAWGYLGLLYETEKRFEDALTLTRRAMVKAQRVDAPEALYKWQWQAGRLLAAQGQTDAAIVTYTQAVRTLQAIRFELPRRYGEPDIPFRTSVGAVYFGLVDLLLQRAASSPVDEPHHTSDLQRARDIIEQFKASELENYFQDRCVKTVEARRTPLEVISQQAAVVYPIVLPDRIELLVNLPTGLKRFAVPVPAKTLNRTVKRFRQKLQTITSRRYFRDAQELYNWLIRPFEPALHAFSIHTLVFVPDGSLRTIPMAALHDGQQFLIHKYALAITPGLDLTDPQPLARHQLRVLAGGLTQAAHGYRPLPYVAEELEAILSLYPGTLLLDQRFRLETLEQVATQRPFRIVHIASHGEFAHDVKQSFILTANEKVSMDRLEQFVARFRFRDQPLDLLTLSACETALGDDRAALGLAGIAIKAGARSALATLWRVNDQTTAELIEMFYRQLLDPSVSRAVALQRAQRAQLQGETRHPYFWAPFLLINTWL